MEYGCCGLSEEDAIRLHGEDNIEVYLFGFGTLEHSVSTQIVNAPAKAMAVANLGS